VSPLYESRLIQFRLGYTKKTLLAEVTEIEPMMGDNTDLKIQKMVFAIHFRLKGDKDGTFL